MIENVKEEADAPNEYFYESSTHKLYLVPNSTMAAAGTGMPDPKIQFVAGNLQTLISLNSSMARPIRNITIQGPSSPLDPASTPQCNAATSAPDIRA